jgi:ABC-2 type transport system permease protein
MPKMPRNVLLIAKREYLEKIRGRAFRFSTVLVPALMILMLGASFFTTRSLGNGRHIAIAAADPALASAVRSHLLEDMSAKLRVDVVAPATEADQAELTQQTQKKAIDGFLWIGAGTNGVPSATYYSGSTADSVTAGRLRTALNRALLEQRLAAGGMKQTEIDALLKNVSVETLRINPSGETGKSSENIMLGKIMLEIFLLTMPILLYGMDMARSIIEEKSSRIFEVMLSVVRPSDLLTGKLIGIGAVGLTQIAIWVVAAGLLSGTTLAATLMHSNASVQFTWIEGIFFPLYFVLGFLLYSSLFSGLAATCETVQEFQMYAPLAVLPTWISFGMMPVLFNNPGSPWAMGASLFPFTAPFTMVPRMGLMMPPMWQIVLSIVLLIACIWAVLWFSSRLYRIGILMYGKRATLPEIMRWLRYS